VPQPKRAEYKIGSCLNNPFRLHRNASTIFGADAQYEKLKEEKAERFNYILGQMDQDQSDKKTW
jgi:hypothetical protein